MSTSALGCKPLLSGPEFLGGSQGSQWFPQWPISAFASCSCCVPSERRHAQNPSSSMLQACSTNAQGWKHLKTLTEREVERMIHANSRHVKGKIKVQLANQENQGLYRQQLQQLQHVWMENWAEQDSQKAIPKSIDEKQDITRSYLHTNNKPRPELQFGTWKKKLLKKVALQVHHVKICKDM